eukprot:scaffold95643_cov58-Phaeocystis_antarctica.AAC.1
MRTVASGGGRATPMTTGGAVPMATSRAVGPGLSLATVATVATLALDFGLALGLGVVGPLVKALAPVLDSRLLHGQRPRPRRALGLHCARAPNGRRTGRLHWLTRPSQPERRPAHTRALVCAHGGRAPGGSGGGGGLGQGELRPAILGLAPQHHLLPDVPGRPPGEDLVERDCDAHAHDDCVPWVLDQVGDLALERRAHLLVEGRVELELKISEAVGRAEEDHLAREAH